MRLFVAVDMDAHTREALAGAQRRLRDRAIGGSVIRWVRPEQLHLTLVFLGEIPESLANAVIGRYAEPVGLSPFTVSFRGAGAFPSRGAPRALWIGLGEGERQLLVLQQVMADRARSVGIQLEARAFSPHLTVGRWKESRPSDRRLVGEVTADETIARTRVERATLYHSRLGASSTGGPTYTPLAHATLTASR